MANILLSTAYLAPVEYYMALAKAETAFLEQWEFFQKQSYRNRCNIVGANGVMALTIPVEKPSGQKVLTRDIRISEHSDWQQQHWRSIESAYNSTPFFEFYKDDFIPFYQKKWLFLWDFNLAIQNTVLELLDLNPKVEFTQVYSQTLEANILDLRESIHPKLDNNNADFQPYYQVFEQKHGFQKNLSIVDLLFNMGNESQLIINNL